MRIIRRAMLAALLVAVGALVLAPTAPARQYEVKVTNLTSGQPLTPAVAAIHRGKRAIFKVGGLASVGLRELAENGNSAPLLAFLEADPFNRIASFTETETGPLVPAGTPGAAMFDDKVTFRLRGGKRARRISLASMLICTNDGFTGVESLRLPNKVGKARGKRAMGYDARTEINTEDFADLVPPCQGLIGVSSDDEGTGVSNPELADAGRIRRHRGIQGGADLDPAIHGWRNPVARITVERVR